MAWKKSPPELVELFADIVPGPPAVQRKMFGYPAGFINGKMFMGLFQDSLILRLEEAQCAEFLKLKGAKPFAPMPGRPMRGFVSVPADLLARRAELQRWINRALAYGESLAGASEPKKKRRAALAKPARAKR